MKYQRLKKPQLQGGKISWNNTSDRAHESSHLSKYPPKNQLIYLSTYLPPYLSTRFFLSICLSFQALLSMCHC